VNLNKNEKQLVEKSKYLIVFAYFLMVLGFLGIINGVASYFFLPLTFSEKSLNLTLILFSVGLFFSGYVHLGSFRLITKFKNTRNLAEYKS
jgi:hypothetical protein